MRCALRPISRPGSWPDPPSRNATVLLRAAAEEGEGLRVTASGTLSLASVARMRTETAWPNM